MRLRAFALASIVFSMATSSFAYRVAAWIPPWNSAALSTIQKNGGSIQESNPVWYSLNADGSIAKNWNAEASSWRAAMTGSELVPTIQNIVSGSFSKKVGASVISASSREAHASAIAQLVITNAFDGIDIDYESLPPASRDDFTAFVTLLADKLHAANKKLSVTVYSKWNANAQGNGGDAEDYTAIGAVADSVKIMAYDYHESSTGPGAITPLDWLDQVATYAQSHIPPAKVMIGLPWYGYDWSSSAGVSNVTYASSVDAAQKNGAAISHTADGEATFTYGDHTVYFQDAASYAAKVQMLIKKHAAIGGFAHWAAGVEDPAIWGVIRAGFAAPAPIPAQPAPVDFTISGPGTLTLQQGSQATGDYRLVPVNDFNSTATVSLLPVAGFNAALTSSASTVKFGSPVTARVAASTPTPAGTYQMIIRFTSGSLVHDQIVNVVVTAATSSRRRGAAH